MEALFGTGKRPIPPTQRPKPVEKESDFVPIIKPARRQAIRDAPGPIVHGDLPKPVFFEPSKPVKQKKKKEKKIKEPFTADYDVAEVMNYIATAPDDEFPKRGISIVRDVHGQSNPMIINFLYYVIEQRKVDKSCLEHFINDAVSAPDATLNTDFLMSLCDFIKTVFDSSKIQAMQTSFVMEAPMYDEDIRHGFSIHAHEDNPPHIVSMPKMLERQLPNLNKLQKDVVTAMQIAFATCMEIAFHYGAVFVTTDFTVRSTVGFKPIGHGGHVDVDQLVLSYKFMHMYRLMIMQRSVEDIDLYELYYIFNASSSTNDDYFIQLPEIKNVDVNDDIAAEIIRKIVNTISRF